MTTAPRPRIIRGLDAEQRKASRRQALLDAGLDLFPQQGFAKTSIEQLCQHAYVGTKAFYETFASRDELYEALLRSISDRVFGELAQVATEGGSEEELAPRILSAFAHAFVDDVRFAQVTFGAGSAITPEAELQRRANRQTAAAFVEGLWAQFGNPSRPEDDGVAIGLIGGLFDVIAHWVRDLGDEAPTASTVDLLVTRMVNLYRVIAAGRQRGL
ncbi:TetR/AcrR family transcriptional regulator [Nocardioides jejuensis]|uniref:TetR/AcrR family transcriptional regulator n=1 Tax=Nocardioides jejuensis TaxID=2502782 RepID=A0A4R1CFN0_9ACTN|nr:TetR/AcrR family transcriptional regulator [Nocardioides jejuensis]TCJ29919.1 TetR/AcrR family transcriptional regulator [Nocardioides jejuensis]